MKLRKQCAVLAEQNANISMAMIAVKKALRIAEETNQNASQTALKEILFLLQEEYRVGELSMEVLLNACSTRI